MDSQTPNTESDFANEVREVFTAARSGSLNGPSLIDGSSAGSASEAGAGATDVSEFSEGVRKALESSRKKYEELLGEQQGPARGAARGVLYTHYTHYTHYAHYTLVPVLVLVLLQ